MIRKLFSSLCLFSCLFVWAQEVPTYTYPKDAFISPLDIPLRLSGTFGELRGNHFHSGIDIKTNGREGLPVKAVADGEVYRIKVSPYGFGKALYVRHANGFVSVYAHLQRFDPKVEAFVREVQYRQKRYETELFPPRGLFAFAQGDTLAFSGNSGGSGGPHLHFEIRDARTEKVINPLLFGFLVEDDIAPKLNYLQVYEFAEDELITSEQIRILEVGKGRYALSGSGLVEFSGSLAFGLNVYDKLNGANNRNGVYCISLSIDSIPQYQFTAHSFAFDETRYINSHIDFPRKVCCRQVINRLYLEPGNRLSMYQTGSKMNLYAPNDNAVHHVDIVVTDVAGNHSKLSFDVQRKEETDPTGVMENGPGPNIARFLHKQTNFFKREEVQFVLPEGALYRDVFFEYSEMEPCQGCVSKTYQLGDLAIPVHRYYALKIKIPPGFKGDKSKLCVVSAENGRIADFEGALREGDFIVARTRQLGNFALAQDSEPPVLAVLNLYKGKPTKGQRMVKVKMEDGLSGIDHYEAYLDGKWILMEYDAKNKLLLLDLDREKVGAGAHRLKIEATDKLGNTAALPVSLNL